MTLRIFTLTLQKCSHKKQETTIICIRRLETSLITMLLRVVSGAHNATYFVNTMTLMINFGGLWVSRDVCAL